MSKELDDLLEQCRVLTGYHLPAVAPFEFVQVVNEDLKKLEDVLGAYAASLD